MITLGPILSGQWRAHGGALCWKSRLCTHLRAVCRGREALMGRFCLLGLVLVAAVAPAQADEFATAVDAAMVQIAPSCAQQNQGDETIRVRSHTVFLSCAPDGDSVTATATLDMATCSALAAHFLGERAAEEFRSLGGVLTAAKAGSIMRTFSICTLVLHLPLEADATQKHGTEAG